MLTVAIGLRWWIVQQPGLGHENDLALFERWIRGLGDHGLGGFYTHESFCDYPPLMLLLFRGLSALLDAFSSDPSSHLVRSGIKTLACLGDLAIGGLLLAEGRKLFGLSGGILAASLYLLSPVAIYDSAYWGQVDSVHTALLLGALVLVRRRRWETAGLFGALSLAAKFQSIAVLPLLLFEAYRVSRTRGLVRTIAGGIIGTLIVAAPFLYFGTIEEMVSRAYINVVGQYHEMSKNAYNVWFLFGNPERSDTVPPEAILRLASHGRDIVGAESAWLLDWTWRRISLIVFGLGVATVLSLHARGPSSMSHYRAAGLLALCFYLFPTEMHERYAYPAIAFLALWAVASRSSERGYWALTTLLLLNFAAVLPVSPLAEQIAAANLLLFTSILAGLAIAQPWQIRTDQRAVVANTKADTRTDTSTGTSRSSVVIRGFQSATGLAVVLSVAFYCVISIASARIPRSASPDDVIWLADMDPEVAEQGWKELALDRSVSGGLLRMGNVTYLRGIGTHAPATLVYAVPPDCDAFHAIVGIDAMAAERGTSILQIRLDGGVSYRTPVLTARSGPLDLQIDVRDRKWMTLELETAGDGKESDHVDLAMARFVQDSGDRSGESAVLERVELGTLQVRKELACEQDRAHLPELGENAPRVPLLQETGP